MKAKVLLTNNKAYRWKTIGNVMFKGYLLEGTVEDVISRLSDCRNIDECVNVVNKLDGSFAIIVNNDDCVFAVADRVRSIPLFYEWKNDEFIIYDTLAESEIRLHEINKKAVGQFEHSLFVMGCETLLENVYQIEAGTVIQLSNDCNIRKEVYWKYNYAKEQITDRDIACDVLLKAYNDTFSNIASLIGDRTVVIPLSGGHDSRLVAYWLKKFGCKNIITYTYGKAGNSESEISKKVAEALGAKHYFINYNRRTVKGFKSIINDYMLYAGNCTSVPLIQELVSILYLKFQGIVDDKCVVVPGLGGVITGHYVYENYLSSQQISCESLINFIVSNYFTDSRLTEIGEINALHQELKNEVSLNATENINGTQANEIFESYTYKEEQSKFIANAVRAYEYFGLQWIIPLFGSKIFDTWSTIDNSLRFDDNIFKNMERIEYGKVFSDIPFVGSKEIKHFHNDSKNDRVLIWKTRFYRYLIPNKLHYLNLYIDKTSYYHNLLFNKSSGINYNVKRNYIRLINLYKR